MSSGGIWKKLPEEVNFQAVPGGDKCFQLKSMEASRSSRKKLPEVETNCLRKLEQKKVSGDNNLSRFSARNTSPDNPFNHRHNRSNYWSQWKTYPTGRKKKGSNGMSTVAQYNNIALKLSLGDPF